MEYDMKKLTATVTSFVLACGSCSASPSTSKSLLDDNNKDNIRIEKSVSKSATNTSNIIQETVKNPFDMAAEQLRSFLALKYDWDGYGGITPTPETIHRAMTLLEQIRSFNLKAPKAMVSGEGDVSLYWQMDDLYIEANIDEDNVFSYLIDDKKHPYGSEDSPKDLMACTELLDALLSIS